MADILLFKDFSVKGVVDVKRILWEKKITKSEIYSVSSSMTENVSLYINCPAEAPENSHDGRSL